MGLKEWWQRLKDRYGPTALENAIFQFLDYTSLGPLKSSGPLEILDWFHDAELLLRRVQALCRAEARKTPVMQEFLRAQDARHRRDRLFTAETGQLTEIELRTCSTGELAELVEMREIDLSNRNLAHLKESLMNVLLEDIALRGSEIDAEEEEEGPEGRKPKTTKCDHCGKPIGETEILAEISINEEPLNCHVNCAGEAIEDAKFEGSSWSIDTLYQTDCSEITGELEGALMYLMSNGQRLTDSKHVQFDAGSKLWILKKPERDT